MITLKTIKCHDIFSRTEADSVPHSVIILIFKTIFSIVSHRKIRFLTRIQTTTLTNTLEDRLHIFFAWKKMPDLTTLPSKFAYCAVVSVMTFFVCFAINDIYILLLWSEPTWPALPDGKKNSHIHKHLLHAHNQPTSSIKQ